MKALILVDIQNDFLPGGALAVPGGDEIIPLVNRLQPAFDVVVATQDWHPAEHGSFAANHPGTAVGDRIELGGSPQILWPVHCVQGTQGAEFAQGLLREGWARIFMKGTNPAVDSYSGFFDNGHQQDTGLTDFLREQGVRDVFIAGVATDYCVKFTALDAVAQGFRAYVIKDACRGVGLQAGDVDHAIGEMGAAGVQMLDARDVPGVRDVAP